jgi:hypothetical protein
MKQHDNEHCNCTHAIDIGTVWQVLGSGSYLTFNSQGIST